MSAISERARDFWDRISPRERRLVVMAAIATPLIIALWLATSIQAGLDKMEHRNDRMRKALVVVETLRARGGAHAGGDDVVKQMTTDTLSLDTYLDNAAKKASFQLLGTTPHPSQSRNGFVTNSVSCDVENLTIEQLKDFLTNIESDSKFVAVTHLEIRRDYRDKSKLRASLEVSTYSKEPKSAAGSGSGGSGTGS